MTLPEFSQMYAVLAVQLNDTNADEVKIRSYFKALADLEPEFVALAAERLARTAEWFPKTSEWLATAMLIERERQAAQQAVLRQRRLSGVPLCASCDDTGWEPGPDGVRKCACAATRRLEVLGRRPMPALLPAAEEPLVPVNGEAVAQTLASTKGMR